MPGGGARRDENSTFSVKKSGGTPNPQVKIVGEPLTLIKFSFRPPLAARSAASGRSRASGGRNENLIRVRGSPHYFDLRVRGTPTFFTENVEFLAKTPQKKSNLGN